MDIKGISIVSGTALLALTATAFSRSHERDELTNYNTTNTDRAGVLSRHHYRHYGWRHGHYRHYGWNRWHRPYYGYGYGYPYNNGYGYGTGLAALATAPLMTGRSVAASGDYCATPVKTCLLYHSSWVGNGCSCKVYDGYARGTVE